MFAISAGILLAAQSGCIGATLAGTDGSYDTPDTGLSEHAPVQAVTAWEGMSNLIVACQIADTFADMLFTGVLDAAYAVHAVLSLTAVGNITDTPSLVLDGAYGITAFKSGGHTYAVVAASRDDGVQILNVTDPSDITAVGSITDGGTLKLNNAYGITTFESGGHTYAAVTAFSDSGVQILNVTDPSDITAVDSITDTSSLELSAAYGITTFESGDHIYAAVTAYFDDGVQILNITNPSIITAAGSITDGGTLELDGPRGITTFVSGGHTYAVVAVYSDDKVQILNITNPSIITAAGSIANTPSLKLNGPRDIAIFESGSHIYAAVAAGNDNGVQILNITNPSIITAAGSIANTPSLELNDPRGITTFKSGSHIYAAVTAHDDDGVQILDVTNLPTITAVGSITDDGTNADDLELWGAYGITTFESGDHIYAAVAALDDNGVQIIRIDIAGSDNTPPTITLTGSNYITITVDDPYNEQGAVCDDNVDADKPATVGGDTVDTSTVGQYTVTYDCTDEASNNAPQVSRTVNVEATPPTFVSSGLDLSTRGLTIIFSETIDVTPAAKVDATKIHIRESGNYTGGGITLSASELVTTTDASTISFTLTMPHLETVKKLTTPELTIEPGAVQGIFENLIVGTFEASTASFVTATSISLQESVPTDIAFSSDGAKMFVIGITGGDVNEYELSTPFDASTRTFVDATQISEQETAPTGIAFSSDGTKMFVVGDTGDDVNEYELSTPFDASTRTFVDATQISEQETGPTGIAFSSDGTKMFVVGDTGDDVNEYELSTPFDASTRTFVDATQISEQETAPRGIAFSSDGTKMFVIGRTGDDVNEYELSTPFDASTLTFVDATQISEQETAPTGIAFSSDGTKMFVVGTQGDDVNEYALSSVYPIAVTGPPAGAFITTWKTTSADESITLPLVGTDITINWGDGSTTAGVSTPVDHTYNTAGDYTVQISGGLERFHLDGLQPNAGRLISIDQWGDTRWTTMDAAFDGATNMVYRATDTPDLGLVSDMSRMFAGAAAFDGDLSSWDVSKVTNMESMFRGASSFNQPLNNWNVSSVTDMTGMFYYASSFNQPLNSWDVSSVSDMGSMFYEVTDFNQPLNTWDVSSVTDMAEMFSGASSFNQPLNSWDVSKVTNMDLMFRSASSFNQPLNSWNVSSVRDMVSMFFSATSFDGTLSDWNVSSVSDMFGMFSSASSFNQPLNNWNVSSVTDMTGMFSGASSFNQTLNAWDVSKVTDMRDMFYQATDFNQPLNAWDVSSVTYMIDMFDFATAFSQNLGEWYVTLDPDTIAGTGIPGVVGTISAQNQPLKNHSPTYVIVDGLDKNHFEIAPGNQLNMTSGVSGKAEYSVNVTASGSNVFENGNNWRMLEITVRGSTNSPPVVQAGDDQTVGEGDTVTLSGSVTPDGDPITYAWSQTNPDAPPITFANASASSTTFVAPAVTGDTTFIITLTANDGTQSAADALNVTVRETGAAFITTWTASDSDKSITLPMKGMYSILWGDGSNSTNVSDSQSHMYSTAGTYTVTVLGDGLKSISLFSDNANALQLESIEQWGGTEWTTMDDAFEGASNMVYRATDAPDLSKVTHTSGMFWGASSFDGDLSGWNVSSVTNMFGMFSSASSFNQTLNSWDVSSVTDISYMFFGASSFDQPLNNWNVSSVTGMTGMFEGATSFNQPLNSWDVSSVIGMGMIFMFHNADDFDQNLGNWYVVANATSIARADVPGVVAEISAQNGHLNGHNPTYGIGSDNDYAFFEIVNGNKINMTSVGTKSSYTVNVTASGSNVFEDGNNWRLLEITVRDSTNTDSAPPAFVSSMLGMVTGSLAIAFSDEIDAANIVPAKIHIRESGNYTGGGITLSASELVTTTDASTISFTLTMPHLETVNKLTTPELTIEPGAVQGIFENLIVGTFDVSTAAFVHSFNVSSQDTSPRGMAFSNNGLKMFVVGWIGEDINEYTLDTPFDVSTAAFANVIFSVLDQERTPTGMAFSNDGLKMFVVGTLGDAINEYTLITPFDLSTASYAGNSERFSVSGQDDKPAGVAFSNDGLKMFVVGAINGINEYTLDTPFDVSTAAFANVIFSVSMQETVPTGVAFSNDGTKMFVVGTVGDAINEYTLNTPFNISVVTHVDSFSVSSRESSPKGVAFSNDGAKMFVVGTVGDAIYEYTLSSVYPITVTERDVNVAPVLNTIDDQTVNEFVELTFTATASDDDSLTFSFDGTVPSGAAITDDGNFTWTPTESQDGDHTITVQVTDGSLTDSETLTVTVNEVNVAPVLNAIGDKGTSELVELTFTATASDTDVVDNVVNTLTFSFDGTVPSGAAITSAGVFTWTPTESQVGSHDITVQVTDGSLTDSETLTVTVRDVNVAPVLNTIDDQTVNEFVELTFTATASDDDSLTFSFDGTVPSGAAITDDGNFTWTPTESQDGDHTITVQVTDGSLTDSETLTVTVNEVNVAPVLNAIGDKGTSELVELTFTATASDTDVVDNVVNTLTFSFDGTVPSGAAITSAGVFTWTPTESQVGSHDITVQVTDGSLTDSETLTVTVRDVNVAPVLNTIDDQTVNEFVELTFTATASDDDSLTFSFDGTVPSGAAITDDGNFTWTPTESQDGDHTITVQVTDGSLTDSETLTVTVNEVNVAPVLNAIGDKGTSELVELTFTATASDTDVVDNVVNTLTFSFDGTVPSGAAITDDGNFTWTPTESQVGSHDITVQVTDGSLTDSETLTVTVRDVNVAPVLNTIDDQTVNEFVELTFTATASDDDSLTFSFDGTVPSGAAITDDGNFTWTPTESQDGDHTITVQVTDGSLTDSETLTVTVNEVNVAPVLNAIGDKGTSELVELTFTATASDTDVVDNVVNTLTFSFDGTFPSGAAITDDGNFTWTPTESQVGSHDITVQVTDGSLTDSETLTVTVRDVNVAPVLNTIDDQTVNEFVELTFTATASDDDSLTFSFDGTVPSGAAITDDGNFTWTPTESQDGDHTITVQVTDGSLTDSETLTVTVNEVNVAPVLNAIGDKGTSELVELTFTATASDTDVVDNVVNTLTFSFDGTVPSGAAITDDGNFTWTPTESQVGSHDITVQVTDGSLTDSETLTVTVRDVNVAPVLNTIDDQTVNEFVELTFTATASDDDSLTFSFDGTVPSGAAITDDGNFTWTPTESQDGDHTITVQVTDGSLTDSETLTVTVNEVNVAPVLNAIGDKGTSELVELTFTATASDTDVVDNVVNTLTFSFDGTVPSGAAITSAGVFTWTPTESQVGSHDITVQVTDGSLTDSETLTVTVRDVNVAPVLNTIDDQTVNELVELTFTATASDDDSLTFSFDGTFPSGAAITDDGNFTWTPTESQDGDHTITVQVTDGSLTDSETLTVTVNEVNVAPVLNAIGDKGTSELVELTFTATASDTDVVDNLVNTLTFSFDGTFPSGAAITDDGNFTWTPTESQVGSHDITVQVTDGSLTDSETLTVTVRDVNVAPVLNTIDDQTVNEFVELTFTATASDDDSLTFSFDGTFPSGAAITDDGNFTWTPTESQDGDHTITVQVTDGSLTDSETLTVTVNEVNVAPVLNTIGDKGTSKLVELTFTATASDTDVVDNVVNTLTFSFDGTFPSGAAITDDGNFTWTPTESQVGSHDITVQVTDGSLTDSETLTVTVRDVNVAPVLNTIDDQTVNELVELTFTATASDDDSLTFSFDGTVPSGAAITDDGNFTWTPTESQDGDHTITVQVTDGSLTDSETLTVTVNEVNVAPVLNAIGDKGTSELVELTFTATASDTDVVDKLVNTLTFSFDGTVPSGAAITDDGNFTWTPTESQVGSHDITVQVTDGSLTDSETLTVTVRDVNVAPVLNTIDDQTVNEFVELTFTATASDDDSLTFLLDGTFPSGAAITDDGNFTWTPTESQDGDHTITVQVTDGSLTDSETLTVTVNEVNVAPVLNTIGDKGTSKLVELTFTATASDTDVVDNVVNTLTFSFDGTFPSGAAITDDGNFTWTPTESQVGSHDITVQVTDGSLTDSETLTVTVRDVNVAPVLNTIDDQTVNELVELTFTATASDDDSLTFSFDGTFPSGAAITDDGNFTWTPTELQDGDHTITVQVTDGSLTDSETLTVTVNEVNVAPVLNTIGDKGTSKLVELTFTATASDTDVVDKLVNTLTFSFDGTFPSGAAITSAGVFTWTPTESQVGSHDITVQVTDGSLTDSETLTVTVRDVNVAPVLNTIDDQTVNEFVELTFTATASDDDSLTFSFDGTFPSGAAITDDGNFTWTPTESQDGDHTITVQVTDGSLTDSETLTVTVNEVNVAPVLNTIDDQTVNELVELTFTATASDTDVVDNVVNTLTFSFDGTFPSGAAITDDGNFTWTPTESQVGSHDITVQVTDSSLTDSETLTVTVKDTTAPRRITLSADAFITTWRTDSANQTITIPVGGSTAKYSIDWGDNSPAETDITGDSTHTYREADSYTVSISGGLERFHLDGQQPNAGRLASIEQWGDTRWTTMDAAFDGATNMVYRATDTPDLSGVTDMHRMFGDATAFNGDLSSWDVSKVTDMSNMFIFAYDFNGNLSSWNVSSVTNMNEMFAVATSFNQPLNSWNVSRVTNMDDMFYFATAFSQNLGNWYVVANATSIAKADVPRVVAEISAQNDYLNGHNPMYGISRDNDYAFFEIVNGNKINMTSVGTKSSYRVNVTASGSNVFEDGNNWRTLVVRVTGDNNADLAGLTISSGTLSPQFSSSDITYTASVDNSVTQVTVTPTASDSSATITVNDNTVTSGNGYIVIGLTVDEPNTVTIIVTAQDSTTKTYTITLTRAASLSGNADLGGLTISSGTLSPQFSSSDITYTASVDNSVTQVTVTPTASDSSATITVNGNTVTSGTGYIVIGLIAGEPNTVTIIVTAQDSTTKTYTITLTRAASLSGNADLGGLTISSGTLSPQFSSSDITYTASVDNSVTQVTVTPTASDSSAAITVNGNTVTSGTGYIVIGLIAGEPNTVTVIVTAQDSTTKTYTITLTRAASLSGNADLGGLTISSGTLSPQFSSSDITYTASVDNSVTQVTVTPTASDSSAAITVNGNTVTSGTGYIVIGLIAGEPNTVTVIVTAQDSTTKIYTITLTRAASLSGNADLGGLTISSGTLSPQFSSSDITYTASVDNSVTQVTVTPTASDSSAAITVNGNTVTSGTGYIVIGLIAGEPNTVTVIVTAQDSTTKIYTITLTRAASLSGNADLGGLTISSGTLSPQFSSSDITYTASVDNSVTQVTVTPTASDSSAAITVNGNTVISGTGYIVTGLTVGTNTVTVIVTAQDSTTKTYTITLTRAASLSGNADLGSLTISSGTLSPQFSSSDITYTASVDNSVTQVTVTPTASDSSATITVNGNTVTSGTGYILTGLTVGTNTVTVIVTAQDSTTKTYIITVTVRDVPITVSSAAYNPGNGQLTITFNQDIATVDYSGLHVRSSANPDTGGITLSSVTGADYSGRTITATLDSEQQDQYDALQSPHLVVEDGAVTDTDGDRTTDVPPQPIRDASQKGSSSSSKAPIMHINTLAQSRLVDIPSHIAEQVESHDASDPLEPITLDDTFDLPLVINGYGYLLDAYENTLIPQTVTAGDNPVHITFTVYTEKEFAHFILYLNLQGRNTNYADSDTYITYKDDGTTSVTDPHGYIGSATVTVTQEDDSIPEKRTVRITIEFGEEPMGPTNMVAYMWNTDREALFVKIIDALEVVAASPESAMQAADPEPLEPDSVLPADPEPVTPDFADDAADPEPVPYDILGPDDYDDTQILQIIRMWSGFESESITDEQLLELLGLDDHQGADIPDWMMTELGVLVAKGTVTVDEFMLALQYVLEHV